MDGCYVFDSRKRGLLEVDGKIRVAFIHCPWRLAKIV